MKDLNIRAIIEWLFAMILVLIVIFQSSIVNCYHLSPMSAHEQSERTFHFGPSEIVEEFDLGDARIYLGKYKEWYSANMVVKELGFLWAPGSGVGGNPIDESEAMSYSWNGSRIDDEMIWRFYGIVNDLEIEQVEIDVVANYQYDQPYGPDQVKTYAYEVDSHQMFLFHWIGDENYARELRGLNNKGDILYQQEFK